MTRSLPAVRRIAGIDPRVVPFDELFAAQEPVVIEGLVRDWPLVRAGLSSPAATAAFLRQFAGDRRVTVFDSPPEHGGRFHYSEGVTALNFTATRGDLQQTLDAMLVRADDPRTGALYIGSTDLDGFLPGLRAANDLGLDHPDFRRGDMLASIWIGNRTTVPAHFDMANNLACCMAGRRRFTLFPPDQVANLYPGPLEPTPAGQVVSMVDFAAPDLTAFPRFPEALAAAQVAELSPGDVLYYPALWWHQVEALDDFNAMINYWWNPVPQFLDTPETTMLHAMLSLRDRPESEKAGWKALFDYYVFGPAERPAAHLPAVAQGALGPLDEVTARRLRAQVLNRMNR